jgi:hypothetical protein
MASKNTHTPKAALATVFQPTGTYCPSVAFARMTATGASSARAIMSFAESLPRQNGNRGMPRDKISLANGTSPSPLPLTWR